jgi:putative membrane protein
MSNEAENQDSSSGSTVNPLRDSIANVLRGFCMGCADVVPGVSGGTVALILGIYERLVTAISNIDGSMLSRIRRGEWRQLAKHIDLPFLTTLGFGILVGIVGMSLVVNDLLTQDTTRSITLAVFFGMIFASAIVLAKTIEIATSRHAWQCLVCGLLGAVFAYWVSTLQETAGGSDPSYVYVFVCGCIAICAMILPGISGAMILLVLGTYEHLTEIPHHLLSGERITESLLTIAVFGTGCLMSLILFSKFLRWLLSRYHAITMAVLCGFMFGALRKLWPFQKDLKPEIEEFKHKEFEVFLPTSFDAQVLAVIIAAAIAIGVVFAVAYATNRQKSS